MVSSKPKICKCGHDKKSHGKLFSTQCNLCECSDYLNRNHPNKFDYIYAFVSIGMFSAVIALMFLGFNEIQSDAVSNNVKSITLSIDTYFSILFGTILIASVLLFFSFIFEPLFDLVRASKRKSFDVK